MLYFIYVRKENNIIQVIVTMKIRSITNNNNLH